VLFLSCPPPAGRRVRLPGYRAEELRQAQPLEVVSAVPRGQVATAREADELIVTFSDAMVPLGADSAWPDFPLLLKPDVSGRVSWLGTRMLSFTPDTDLTAATEYQVTIPKGIKSQSGRMLKQDYGFRFQTPRPALSFSLPGAEARWVARRTPLVLSFTLPMDAARARRFVRVRAARGGRSADCAFALRRATAADRRRLEKEPDTRWQGSRLDLERTLILEPAGGWQREGQYQVVLDSGLPARHGNLGLARTVTIPLATEHQFRFIAAVESAGKVHPEEQLRLAFSNPVPGRELLTHIKFVPAVKLPEASGYYYGTGDSVSRLDVPLAADTTYEIVISKDLKDRFGNRLGRDVKVTLRTTDFAPDISMAEGRSILEAYAPHKYPLRVLNTDTVELALARLDAEAMIRLMTTGYRSGAALDSALDRQAQVSRVWRLPQTHNRRQLLGIDLDEALNGLTGFVALRVRNYLPGLEPKRTARWSGKRIELPRRPRTETFHAFTQITNLGVTAKFSPENALVLVTNLKDAAPAAGARVSLLDDALNVVWSGEADARGLVETPGWKSLRPQARWGELAYEEGYGYPAPGFWVLARSTDNRDQTFIGSRWGTGIGVGDFDYEYDYDYPGSGRNARGFIFTEKGLYHSGDTVHLKGIIRDLSQGRLVLPRSRACSLVVENSRDEDILGRGLTLSNTGSFDHSLALAKDAPSGSYSVTLHYNQERFSASFEVQAYRPVEFEVKVSTPQEQYFASEKLSAKVMGKYLFGAPMAGDRVNWTLNLSPYYFHTPAFPEFSFDYDYSDTRGRRPGGYGQALAQGSGKLDPEGKFGVTAGLDLKTSRTSMIATCEATVTGPSQREASGQVSAIVHRGAFYLGTRLKDYCLARNETLRFDLIAVSPAGKAVAGQNVQVEYFRRNWQSVRQAEFGGRYHWVSRPQDKLVQRRSVRTAGEPVGQQFVPTEVGQYIVKLSSRDRKGNPIAGALDFYVSGDGRAGWEMRDDDRIELKADKEKYQPGDQAKILVKSPYERARAVVTVEREYVMDKFLLDLTGNAPVVTLPIKPEYLPNVYVSVILLKGRTGDTLFSEQGEDLGKPGFKMGYVGLSVSPDEKRLDVKVRPERTSYRPGEEVVLDLEVRSGNTIPNRTTDSAHVPGHGLEAEVTLAVVDLGVLKLIGYDTPDPFPVFYAEHPLAVTTAESRLHVLGQRNYGEKGENRGGGGAEGERAYRQKFLETALWLPAIRTDADGHARTRFKLPDNLTTFKVMAVAHSADRFGHGDSSITVNKPLVLQGALPMFVRAGDEFDAGCVVYNNSEQKNQARVRAEVSGLELVGNPEQTLELAPRASKEVRYHYRAGVAPLRAGAEERKATFTFSARLGSEQDGLKLSLPIREPVISEAFAVYEQTEDSAWQPLALPAKARPGFGELQVTLASSGLVGLEPGIRYLREYPYECLEQKLSRALPFVVAGDLIDVYRLSDLQGAARRQFVQDIIDQLGQFQDQSGGFHYWKGTEYYEPASPYVSAYCLYLLALARNGDAAETAMSPGLVDRVQSGLAFLRDLLASSQRNAWEVYDRRCQGTTRAFVAYVLALWQQDVRGYLPSIYDQREELSVFGRACLLKALHLEPGLAGGPEMENELVREFDNLAKYAPTTVHFEEGNSESYYWIHGSDVRTTALVLQARLEAQGRIPDAEKMVRWLLLERRNGRWRTTQENAYVLSALATYFRVYESEVPDFQARVGYDLKGAFREVLKADFQGRSLAQRERRLALDSLKAGAPGDTQIAVRLAKTGTGRLYYGLRLTYAPLDIKPRTEGLLVRKSITALEGKPATEFRRGQLYKVTLKVYTPQQRLFVVCDDPLAAGFEVVNTDFRTTSDQLRRRLSQARRAEGDRYRWWGSFDHQEIYADRYRLFATSLEDGAHTYTYFVKALTTGKFLIPPTRVEEMYTPEVFGLTGQQVITVR
jgi:uncharacterized protein YfaS (alpha-2-macroglobulin family)